MTERRTVVQTDAAPAAIGPYSQAVVAAGVVYCSGQIPLDPATGELVKADIATETRRVLDNLSAVLDAAGSSLDQVVKTQIFLADMADFASVNEVYAEYFGSVLPARATVAVRTLPKSVRVEIDAIALLNE